MVCLSTRGENDDGSVISLVLAYIGRYSVQRYILGSLEPSNVAYFAHRCTHLDLRLVGGLYLGNA